MRWFLMASMVMLFGFSSGCDTVRQKRFESAVYEGDLEAVRSYLQQGVDVNAVDKDGQVLDLAVANPAILKLLLAHGANPRQRGHDKSTSLHTAAMLGELESVNILLAAGADPLAEDSDGWKPIDSARTAGKTEVIARLEAVGRH